MTPDEKGWHGLWLREPKVRQKFSVGQTMMAVYTSILLGLYTLMNLFMISIYRFVLVYGV
jgi:hypothetical protein